MDNVPEIEKYIREVADRCGNRNELAQIAIANILHSLKIMEVLSERFKNSFLERQSTMGEIQMLTLGIKINGINSEIEKIRHGFLG